MKDKSMTVIQHLEEIRRRLIIIFIALLISVSVGFYFSRDVLELMRKPAGDLNLAILTVGEGFFVYLKISLYLGIAMASPVILYQLVAFILPALERHERRYVYILLPASLFLFVVGVVFAYSWVLPYLTRFFLSFSTDNLRPVISVSAYVSFVFGLILPFGLVFQLPVAVALLTKIGILTPQFLIRNRKFAILGIFIIAAIITPTMDIVSQAFFAVPMLLLYEISILVSRLSAPKKKAEARAQE